MKKVFIVLLICFLFTSCTKEDNELDIIYMGISSYRNDVLDIINVEEWFEDGIDEEI